MLVFMMPLRHVARNTLLLRCDALPHRRAADPLASAAAEVSLNGMWSLRRSGPRALAAGAQLARKAIEKHGGAAAALGALGG
jgi:hypothetical protein